MTKDPRYKNVKDLIQSGHIKTITGIFETEAISKVVVYKDLGIHNVRFNELLSHVNEFKLDDLFRLAELLEIDEWKILELAYNQWGQYKKARRKKL
jgi:hypothetical protein